MIKLIVGSKGSGKTKKLVEEVNLIAETTSGNVVCIEKIMNLTFNINHKVRLIDVDDYEIDGFDSFYGFVAGVLAGNYDITHLYIDGTLRIGNRDMNALVLFLNHLNKLAEKYNDLQITLTLSCEADELPTEVKSYL